MSVQGKHAIITGAGSGINLEFASLLLSRGCSVLIGDLALRPEAEAVLKQYPHPPTSSGAPSALFHKTDVRLWPELSSLFARGLEAFGGAVDVVVPGAGLFEPKWSSFWESETSHDPANAELGSFMTLDVNLTAPIRLSQIAISHWTQNKQKGCLVHIGSIAGYTAAITTPLYFASKHGLHGFVRSLADLRDTVGIRVGAVAPGAVKTPMWKEDKTKSDMITEDSEWIDPKEIAEGMYRLIVDEELGNGTILEVTIGESRVVPLYHLEPPSGRGIMMRGFVKSQQDLLNGLQEQGLKVKL